MIKSFTLNFTLFILLVFLIFCNSAFSDEFGYKIYSSTDYQKKELKSLNERILFIVDFSSSMNEYLGNKRKIDIALIALKNILPKVSKNVQIGLRVYGHRTGLTPVDACMASKLVVPIGYNNTNKIYNFLEEITPVGMTPITYSIKQAVKSDFGLWQGQKRIIILTDGCENCDESPCDYAIKLMEKRNDVKIDVIAFSIDDVSAISQLRCTALVTNGKFYNADTYPKLLQSLEESFHTEKNVEGQIITK